MSSLLSNTIAQIRPLDELAMCAARERQAQLTKPAGSLGRLEEISIRLAGIAARAQPRIRRPVVVTMAGDHGVALRGVSAFPREVTPQMVLNFLRGGAAINVLARHAGARVVVVDMGVAFDFPPEAELVHKKIAPGTNDISQGPAMTRDQAVRAVEAGIEVAMLEIEQGADLLALGEMGIGNTTPSSAIVAAFTGCRPVDLTGRGTGIDDARWAKKLDAVERALKINRPDPGDALDVLSKVGGFEIGGLAGVILAAASRRVPAVIDGFISGAAAIIAYHLASSARPYMIAAHRSAEAGHRAALDHLKLDPLLDLDLRLGEGTGAVLALSLCQAACKILEEMATFADAGVATRGS